MGTQRVYIFTITMSTNKLSHLKEWEKIYLEVTKQYPLEEDDFYYGKEERFDTKGSYINVSDDDTFYTFEELKQLANDGMPKQGELEFWDEVEISLDWEKWYSRDDTTYQFTFMSKVKDKYIVSKANNVMDKFERELYVDWIRFYKYCRKRTKKTELTLAEVESKLGLDKGSLTIKD